MAMPNSAFLLRYPITSVLCHGCRLTTSAQHGSWNRTKRTGYEVIRVPMQGRDLPTGAYEDFMTGFVTDDGAVWGRPAGVTVAADGALLVSDDGGNVVWRVVAVTP